jgi:hypothetical protein
MSKPKRHLARSGKEKSLAPAVIRTIDPADCSPVIILTNPATMPE